MFNNRKKRKVQLLTFNNENRPFYNGYCKIVLNKFTKELIVQPYNEDIKIIKTSFDSNIFYEENILFVNPLTGNSYNFALVFDNQKICKKVFDIIKQSRKMSSPAVTSGSNKIAFEEKFLLPLFGKLDDPQISKILAKFVNLCENEKRNSIVDFIKMNNKNCNNWIEENVKLTNRHYNFRKRSSTNSTKIIKPKKKNISSSSMNKKLLQPIKSENSSNQNIIYKPNYEIIVDDFQIQRLIIFDPTNKELCYEYYLRNCKFICNPCSNIHSIYSISAKVVHFGTDKEYVEILDFNHACDLRPYNRAKFLRQLIYKPMFEFEMVEIDGKLKKLLYVFVDDARKNCYKFVYQKSAGYFCKSCNPKKQIVSARIFVDKDGIECIRMGKNLHICAPKPYNSASSGNYANSVITPYGTDLKLKNDEFTFVPSELGYNPKLIIFDKNDKSLCYEFSSSSTAFYYCIGCSKLNNNYPNYYVKHVKDAKGKDNVIVKNAKHACKPFKFDPSKYKSPRSIKPEKYMFYKNAKGTPKMVIFASDDKKLCYNYLLNNRDKIWYCTECARMKKNISAKVRIDFDNEEYVQLGNAEHICEPVSYAFVKTMIAKIVKSTDIIIPKRIEGKGNISSDPFELRPNKEGTKDRILIIFPSGNNGDKSKCYVFLYKSSTKSFNCKSCIKKKVYISAKICEKNGKQYIMMGQRQHICEPLKYESLKH